MSTDKRISQEYNGQTFVDADSGYLHFRASNPAEPGDGYAHKTEAWLDKLADNVAELDQAERDEIDGNSLDVQDEIIGSLLLAIETARAHIRNGYSIKAGVVLAKAVEAYKEYITRLTPPAHLAAMWEGEPDVEQH